MASPTREKERERVGSVALIPWLRYPNEESLWAMLLSFPILDSDTQFACVMCARTGVFIEHGKSMGYLLVLRENGCQTHRGPKEEAAKSPPPSPSLSPSLSLSLSILGSFVSHKIIKEMRYWMWDYNFLCSLPTPYLPSSPSPLFLSPVPSISFVSYIITVRLELDSSLTFYL